MTDLLINTLCTYPAISAVDHFSVIDPSHPNGGGKVDWLEKSQLYKNEDWSEQEGRNS